MPWRFYPALALSLCGALVFGTARGAKDGDLVTEPLPGFPRQPFKVYSGFLNVSDTQRASGYDRLVIHYQFDVVNAAAESAAAESAAAESAAPVAVWHTGGPGGSSIYGLYGETGYFQVSASGTHANARYSWNNLASMLYLESPAGSFLSPFSTGSGFSYCEIDGQRQDTCTWNDATQAAAYALTLEEFFAQFPEWASNDLYLVGESYAGQYIPNIAHRIQSGAHPNLARRLKGIAVGNGCWGGGTDTVMCNGPNEDKNLVELYYGKGLISRNLHEAILKACSFPDLPYSSATGHAPSTKCKAALKEMDDAVGPHNVYNVYDNCPSGEKWHVASGKSTRWLGKFLHENMHRAVEAHKELAAMGAGYDWTCGQFEALPAYIERADVKKVLHLPAKSLSSAFGYNSTGPASVTLYPSLIKSGIRVLIYNGDADSCVPYIGNEEWTLGMVAQGVVSEAQAWHPWYAGSEDSVPAGYATNYALVGGGGGSDAIHSTSAEASFSFVTMRLAGHEVPHYRPRAAYNLFERFLNGKAF
jgi:hypothetical protein